MADHGLPAYRNPLRAMAKEELIHIPVLGWLLSKAGMFGVNRGKDRYWPPSRRAMKVLKEGGKLLLFPEGTRVTRERRDRAGTQDWRSHAGRLHCGVPHPYRCICRAGKALVPPLLLWSSARPYYPRWLPEKDATQEEYQRHQPTI